MDFERINYKRLYEIVLSQLEKLFESGKLKPGDQLPPERQLSEMIGVSRGTLREAFRVLERQGVIESRPGGGRFLRKLPNADKAKDMAQFFENLENAAIYDLIEARELIETKIVELAILRATEEDIEAIGETLIKNSNQHISVDQAFHLAIAKATQNQVFYNIIKLNLDLLYKTREKTFKLPGRAEQMKKEHYKILDAIRTRDLEGGKEAILKHLHSIEETYEKFLK